MGSRTGPGLAYLRAAATRRSHLGERQTRLDLGTSGWKGREARVGGAKSREEAAATSQPLNPAGAQSAHSRPARPRPLPCSARRLGGGAGAPGGGGERGPAPPPPPRAPVAGARRATNTCARPHPPTVELQLGVGMLAPAFPKSSRGIISCGHL